MNNTVFSKPPPIKTPVPDLATVAGSGSPAPVPAPRPCAWQHRADRHTVPHRRFERPDVCRRPLQGLGPQRPRHPGARRAFPPCRSRERSAVGPDGIRLALKFRCTKTCGPQGPQVFFRPNINGTPSIDAGRIDMRLKQRTNPPLSTPVAGRTHL
jgi:hypothetical protein